MSDNPPAPDPAVPGTAHGVVGRVKAAAAAFDAWQATATGARVVKGVRWAFTLGLAAFLVSRLVSRGVTVEAFLAAMPRQPLFYAIWFVLYFQLPVVETWIYQHLWRMPFRELFPAILRKRVLSQDVLGYSGELYLYAWARPRRPEMPLLSDVKDNVLMSSFASVGSAVLLIGGMVLTGTADLSRFFEEPRWVYAVLAALVLVLAVSLGTRARRALFGRPAHELRVLAVAHFGRFFLGFALQMALWYVVLPQVPLSTWAAVLTMQAAIDRIPFLPSSDLAFVALVVQFAGPLGVSEAALSGLFVTRYVLDKLLNLGFFVLAPLLMRGESAPPAAGTP